jgi:virginiamycin B lyase
VKLPLRRPAVLLTTAVATLAVTLPGTALAHHPDKNVKEFRLAEFAVPAGVATGKDGALWVTARTTGQIHRVKAGEITSYQIPTPDAFPTDIVAGRDGALWFTESSGNKIGRITTAGELTEYPLDVPDALPAAIVAGRDGQLYFTEGNTNAITRMNTNGEVTGRSPLPTAFATPLGLAPTRHGVYVSQHSAGSIGLLSYGGYFGRSLRTRSAPDRITIGPDGNLWYAAGNDAKIGHIELNR